MRARPWFPGLFTLITLPVIAAATSLPRPDHIYLEAELPVDDATKLIALSAHAQG